MHAIDTSVLCREGNLSSRDMTSSCCRTLPSMPTCNGGRQPFRRLHGSADSYQLQPSAAGKSPSVLVSCPAAAAVLCPWMPEQHPSSGAPLQAEPAQQHAFHRAVGVQYDAIGRPPMHERFCSAGCRPWGSMRQSEPTGSEKSLRNLRYTEIVLSLACHHLWFTCWPVGICADACMQSIGADVTCSCLCCSMSSSSSISLSCRLESHRMLCNIMRDVSTPTALCQLSLLHGTS